ncbi:hypothetical protein BJF78_17885 [Pseudonocardia sp. CNS-139]|nr:hypothetical protein BJF78_17885 [Pseudonocardia sp. CNS-139]
MPTTEPPVTAAPTTTRRPRPTTTPPPPPLPAGGPAGVAAEPQTGPPAIDWQRTGGDEFDAPALDTVAWNLYNGVGGFGNGLRRPEAISQVDGKLRITGRGEVSGGMGHRFDQLYGRWEFRARTDAGRGYGSAILLWPESEKWPDDGELDMMEVPSEDRVRAHFVIHWGEENHVDGTNVPGDFTQWHTFAMDWLPDRITWYIDGVKQWETTDPEAIARKPMHITIQLDQGPYTTWLPARDDTTPPEVSLEVDWVRIYQAPDLPPPAVG